MPKWKKKRDIESRITITRPTSLLTSPKDSRWLRKTSFCTDLISPGCIPSLEVGITLEVGEVGVGKEPNEPMQISYRGVNISLLQSLNKLNTGRTEQSPWLPKLGSETDERFTPSFLPSLPDLVWAQGIHSPSSTIREGNQTFLQRLPFQVPNLVVSQRPCSEHR